MLYFIKDNLDPYCDYFKDDPVRPEISSSVRIGQNKFAIALLENNVPTSISCVSLLDFIPSSVSDLFKSTLSVDTAVFYTIWSYIPGNGSLLLKQSLRAIKELNSNINNFVTLSPKTPMARNFHIKNGATIFRENIDTINYQYILTSL